MSNNQKRWGVKQKNTSGFEMEMFILDKYGKVSFSSEHFIDQVNKRHKGDPNIYVTKETGKHMVEIGAVPSDDIRKSFASLISHLELLWEIAAQKDLLLYPFATYPGPYEPEMHNSFWYSLQEKLWGSEKWRSTGLNSSFHYHFSIESKTYDKKKRSVAPTGIFREDQAFMSSYNFMIASDPVLTTFMQSSPFMQGQKLAKDSRMISYRKGKSIISEIAENSLPLFYGLQQYINTITDLTSLIDKRHSLFVKKLFEMGFDENIIKKHTKKLDTAWNPVKINKHGTFEQRGMDMNLPSYALGVSLLLQNALRRIIKEKITIVPSDTKRPFTFEGSCLYVSPICIVQDKLQDLSAYEGLSNDEIFDYCQGFYKFSSTGISDRDRKLLVRVDNMLKERKTISDKFIEEASNFGIIDNITEKKAAQIALYWSKIFFEDILFTKKLLV